MVFIKKDILWKTMAVVDIWSYKVRACVCSFKNNKITLLWYWEKRQWNSCFLNWECEDIEVLTDNVRIALEKAELNAWKKIKKVVISFPFTDMFFSSKKISYKRKEKNEPIIRKELEEILENSEDIVLRRTTDNIKKISWFQKEELKLIIWNILQIDLDKKKKKHILWKVWKDISISFHNVFIPLNKYNFINYVWNVLNKKIVKIIPTEYSITRVFLQKDLVIINIWASMTYITIKKDDEVMWISKILLWINDLIEMIGRNIKDTSVNIINNLNNNIYLKEKEEFIDVWWNMLSIWIKEIVKNKICPSDFVLLWGGKNNFIKEFFNKSNPISKNIKFVKNIRLIKFQNDDLKKQVEDYNITLKKIRLDTLSMLLEINNLLWNEKTLVSELLRKTLTKLGF